jgi:hypothetical protein
MFQLSEEPIALGLPMTERALLVVDALPILAVEGKKPLQAAHMSIGDNMLLDIAPLRQRTSDIVHADRLPVRQVIPQMIEGL